MLLIGVPVTRRVTVEDVANHAGVSVATVDRVLNKRRPVRPGTAEVVVAAAEALNYYASPLMRRRAAAFDRQINFGFVLQKESKRYYAQLANALEQEVAKADGVRGFAHIAYAEELSPAAHVGAMRKLADKVDVIGVVSVDHPYISDEIAKLKRRHIPVVSLLSGLSSQDIAGHVGSNGRIAGRTAAWTIDRCAKQPGNVAVLIGSHRYVGHEDREIGFRSYFRENKRQLEIAESVTYLDDEVGAYGTMLDLLSSGRNLAGCYVIGGGTSGIIRAVREEGASRTLSIVCHELDDITRDGLLDGTIDMVIASPPEAIASKAVATLIQAASNPNDIFGTVNTPLEIYVSENV